MTHLLPAKNETVFCRSTLSGNVFCKFLKVLCRIETPAHLRHDGFTLQTDQGCY